MKPSNKNPITVRTQIKAPVETVWNLWTTPRHIKNWNSPSDDWHTTHAENDLRRDGKFLSCMEAKDGSTGFDFAGTYDQVEKYRHVAYTLEDGRKVNVEFTENGSETGVKETFDPESENSREMQRDGWQAILNNFKRYAENKKPKTLEAGN